MPIEKKNDSVFTISSEKGLHLKTCRVIRELFGHLMVEIYGQQSQLTRKKEKENIAIILSSPCETSSNGIHLKTNRVIRELIAHMMVELPINMIQKETRKPSINSLFTM